MQICNLNDRNFKTAILKNSMRYKKTHIGSLIDSNKINKQKEFLTKELEAKKEPNRNSEEKELNKRD